MIDARNGAVMACPGTAAVVLTRHGGSAAPYPFDPASLGPKN